MRTAWVAAFVLAAGGLVAAQSPDPFGFYGETVSLTATDRTDLSAGRAIVKMLPHGDQELAIFSAVRAEVPGDRLAGWIRAIEALKRSEHVPAIGRFSNPPRVEDLNGLELDPDDLDAIRRCRPGSCGVKLSADEITELRQVIAGAGGDWHGAVQQAFRQMLLERVQAYLAAGLRGMPPYHDQRYPTPLDVEFDALIENSPYLSRHVPAVVSHFERFPASDEDVESFLYWAKEALGGKPIVSLTHVAIATPGSGALPEVLVASRQFYATHYLTGSLALTAIVGGADGQPRYLTYLNRSRLDVLGGLFGGLARRVIQGRLRTEATDVVEDLRRRLESGMAPRLLGEVVQAPVRRAAR